MNKTTPKTVAIISSFSARMLGTLNARAMETDPLHPPHQRIVCSGKEISDLLIALLT